MHHFSVAGRWVWDKSEMAWGTGDGMAWHSGAGAAGAGKQLGT